MVCFWYHMEVAQMATFNEGDRVRLIGKFGQDKGQATIDKVLKTRLVLSNGWRCDLEGFKLSDGGMRLIGAQIEKINA